MYVDIGIPGQPLVTQAALTDNDSSGWVGHTGTYVVPANQTVTRFAFVSAPMGSGNPMIGNFLDDISFGTPSCVVASKSVTPTGPVSVGETLTYSIPLTNQGGSQTQDLHVRDGQGRAGGPDRQHHPGDRERSCGHATQQERDGVPERLAARRHRIRPLLVRGRFWCTSVARGSGSDALARSTTSNELAMKSWLEVRHPKR